jgi:hypothetical protein
VVWGLASAFRLISKKIDEFNLVSKFYSETKFRMQFHPNTFFVSPAASSHLHPARVSLPICSARPCGAGVAGAFRLFLLALVVKLD